jgi:hypothetical protein
MCRGGLVVSSPTATEEIGVYARCPDEFAKKLSKPIFLSNFILSLYRGNV